MKSNFQPPPPPKCLSCHGIGCRCGAIGMSCHGCCPCEAGRAAQRRRVRALLEVALLCGVSYERIESEPVLFTDDVIITPELFTEPLSDWPEATVRRWWHALTNGDVPAYPFQASAPSNVTMARVHGWKEVPCIRRPLSNIGRSIWAFRSESDRDVFVARFGGRVLA